MKSTNKKIDRKKLSFIICYEYNKKKNEETTYCDFILFKQLFNKYNFIKCICFRCIKLK